MERQQELHHKTVPTMIRRDLMLFCRYVARRKINYMEKYHLLILQEVRGLLIMHINVKNKLELMGQKLIKVYLHLKNVSEPWIRIKIILLLEAVS